MSSLSQSLTFTVNGTTSTSVVYPQNTIGAVSYTGNKEKGDGYFGSSDGLHTVAYTVTENFIGSVKVQGTLSASPADTDWFDIAETVQVYEYPGENSTRYANFTGLFVWVRPVLSIEQGALHTINYNH